MKVIRTVAGLQKEISEANLSPVGFVPTMGALHDGHISLVEFAITRCQLLVISIYVNPAQFNDKNDLKNYPRDLGKDLSLLDKTLRKTDLVFAPDDSEIYPEEDNRQFHFGNLEAVMEGIHRPGHFNGVAKVVSRFFDIVNPDFAVFGLKDFQQLAIIKELVRQTGSRVKIIGRPILREKDGLAMSSRNQLLEPPNRKDASVIYKTLAAAAEMISDHDIPDIKSFVRKNIDRIPEFEVEYFDVVDDTELMPVNHKTEFKEGRQYYGCIAVKAGKIRLIDNIVLPWSVSKG
jgi:pantoate--beta-alanine ligase